MAIEREIAGLQLHSEDISSLERNAKKLWLALLPALAVVERVHLMCDVNPLTTDVVPQGVQDTDKLFPIPTTSYGLLCFLYTSQATCASMPTTQVLPRSFTWLVLLSVLA